MKTQKPLGLLTAFAILFLSFSLQAQEEGSTSTDSTGLPGDNFSLEGAIELFKKAESPEDFEKLLNQEDNKVNNLDLNEDGEIDYIRVVDNMDSSVHAIILQVPLSESESQDIAVIEIEKQGDENAILQIIGDEDIYGEQVIVEPFEEENANVKKGKGSGPPCIEPVRVVVNVWFWPCVRFVYRPTYVVWVSPWRWRYYPPYWRPWRPYPWHAYHVRVTPYHAHCHVVTTHRVVHAHAVYAPRRTHSTVVHTRTTTTVTARKNYYGTTSARKTTTTTTSVAAKNKQGGGAAVTKQTTTTSAAAKNNQGGAAAARQTTTTSTAKNKNGQATQQKTTTTAAKKGKNGNAAAGHKTTKTKTVRRKGKGG